jgi:membrane-bound lytic murein transglycosylase MltF
VRAHLTWTQGTGRIAAGLACLLLAAGGRAQTPAAPAAPAGDVAERRLPVTARPWSGDFEGMVERRLIRVLVPYSRTLYFNDKGHERGLSAESVRRFEKWLDAKYAKKLKNRPLTVFIGPRTRDRLLPDLAAGIGDVAVGNLTITAEREALVDFVPVPNVPVVNEVVVTGPGAPALGAVDGLAGKTVHVRRASSYFESLQALNQRFAAEGRPAVNVVLVPDAVEDEDLLEMVDAGILEAIVVDDWKGRMWAQVLTNIRVNEQAIVRAGSQLGWAIRKDCPQLRAEIVAFLKAEATKAKVSSLLGQYMRRIKRLKNPAATTERKRFEQLYALFVKYGERYHFDPLMLAAQGFQESRLDQAARSQVGAIGVMQVMPDTGKELKVGDILLTEPNIHAGAKYMDQLMTRYFADARFDELNRTLFAFASYNAGPGNMAKMRAAAEKAGLDPDQWFNNVELITARKIGIETTTYVRNIYKYYVAYKLTEELQASAQKAREQVRPAGGSE